MIPHNLFVSSIAPQVVQACAETRLYPSLMLAQVCLESNWGRSKLATLHHNYFGIKAGISWKGKVVVYETKEYSGGKYITMKQSFRSYASMTEGFADRISFLQKNKRYALHGVFDSKTVQEQARNFQRAGYATDPFYAQKLIKIIDQYSLEQYDTSK
jgi:flagellum-specific peptidoglycan hydrolase FlgJ